MTTSGPQISVVPPGFGLQGADYEFFLPDSTLNQVVTLEQGSQVPVQLPNFNNLDAVTQWYLSPSLNVTAPTGTTNTVAPNAPYTSIQNLTVNVQNQFFPLKTTGIDLYIKNTIWPWYPKSRWGGQLPVGAQTYPAPQTRLLGADAETISATNVVWNDLIPIGPAMRFDAYSDIDFASGMTLATNGQVFSRAYVGPQILGGTNRTIFAEVNFNPIVGNNNQSGLYTVSGTQTAAGTGTATLNTYRDGYYNMGPGTYPNITNWVPVYITYPITIGSTSNWVYDLPKTFQILGVIARFYDPSTGTVPAASAISSLKFKIGSGVYLANDIPSTNQWRLNKHIEIPNQLPEGVYGWDLAHDHNGNVTNRRAINTIVTNGAQIEVDFSTPMSSQGQVYLSVLALQYVEQAGI